jgi:hypothetical protein
LDSLWPTDIGASAEKAPVTILKEQATILGTMTNNIVKAEVVATEGKRIPYEFLSKTHDFGFSFYIVAPALNNYRYQLFTIYHNLEFYPLAFKTETERNDLRIDVLDNEFEYAENEMQFLQKLKIIFGSQKTRRIIGSIMSQSRGLGDEPSEHSDDHWS